MRTLKDKKILVTGGAGFIGSHVVDAIIRQQPAEIVVATNFFLGKRENLDDARRNFSKLEIITADMANPREVKQLFMSRNFDVIYNLAVVPLPTSLVMPEYTYQKNLDITLNICEYAREKAFESLIHFSSSEAYGTAKYVPMDESHPLDPTTPYAASKAASDQLVISYQRTFGIDASIIRPFNNYGPRQNARKYAGIIPLTVGRILKGEDLIVNGSGNQTRDWTYVEDTANATVDVYDNESTRGHILNIASGKETTINQLVDAIVEYTGYGKHRIKHVEARPADLDRHYADISLATRLISFRPSTKLEEGIKKTIDWYMNHKEVF